MLAFKWNWIVFVMIIQYLHQVTSECPKPFYEDNQTHLCSYSDQTVLSWSEGYNQCLTEPLYGSYMEIHSIKQFEELKNIREKGSFWLGANNFVRESQWHWLDGSIVDKSIVTWCENSTYETAIGTQCAAYDSTFNCIINYPCNTYLTTLCVPKTDVMERQGRSVLTSRAVTSTGICTNAYAGAYANWWTYSVLLLNWFILFCFTLYVLTRFNLNKITTIIAAVLMILSFVLILIFAVLWGVQYESALKIPIAVVVIGSVAGLIFLIVILILVSNRNRVRRWKICMIVTIVTIIIQSLLMLGLVLCIAHCSGFISLTSTAIDKDVIAALIASIIAAISIMFFNVINYLLGYIGQDRVHAGGPIPFNNEGQQKGYGTHHDRVERSTSPVDPRIINEFYSDQPKSMHQYQLEGRQYVVYEGNNFSDVEPYRRDLTQAMLSQEPHNLETAIARVKASNHSEALADEINQAENLLNQLR